MPLQPVALADTYRNISLKQDQFSSSFATLTANSVTDTLTLIAGPGISLASGTDTITILNDFGDENSVISVRGIQIDGIMIDTNVIQMTDSNANLEIRANGSGSVYVNDSLIVQNDLTVRGNLTGNNLTQTRTLLVTENSTFQGPIVAQNDVTIWGSLNLTGDINGGPLRTDDIQIVGNRIETTVSNSNLELYTSGTGALVVNGQIAIDSNEIRAVATNDNLLLTANGTGRIILSPQLEVNYGGTGVTTFTVNGIVYGNSTDPLLVTAASNPGSNATTSYGILTTDGSNVPLWTDVIDGGSY